MKDFIVVLVILGVIFGGNYFIHEYIEKSGKDFLTEVDNLRNMIDLDEKTKNRYVSQLLKLWENNEKKWIMIGYHQEINEIEDLLIECYSYYLQGELKELDISYRKLERCLDDLKNREKITVMNIL